MLKLRITVALLFMSSIVACSSDDPVSPKVPRPITPVSAPQVTTEVIAKPEPNTLWKIDSVERIDAPLARKRTAIVLYPKPESKEALRECVRTVYARMRDEIMSRQPSEKASLNANVLVRWDDMDQRIGGSIANANFDARGKPLPKPADIPDAKISIRSDRKSVV